MYSATLWQGGVGGQLLNGPRIMNTSNAREEEPDFSRSRLMRLETSVLGITANCSHIRNGNKKVLEEMKELASLFTKRLWVSRLVLSAKAV